MQIVFLLFFSTLPYKVGGTLSLSHIGDDKFELQIFLKWKSKKQLFRGIDPYVQNLITVLKQDLSKAEFRMLTLEYVKS